ncbi:hypothetical protein NBH00_01370 [Paraconexibacter antarcticus]|uniref:ADP-ribosylglycohydrolase family protein n=1 Tax=Paraconexibacter antarcticus TaxID=2949664 RepID=A0ABY5DTR8_9ACTN|nr:hypothetical protein [Paraconexibacter antarcticus]UTI64870.1 hypothetical protein NBH00_01370 [Paraconexibacter antarcticus]
MLDVVVTGGLVSSLRRYSRCVSESALGRHGMPVVRVVQLGFRDAAQRAFSEALTIRDADDLAAYVAVVGAPVFDGTIKGRLDLADVAGRYAAAVAAIDQYPGMDPDPDQRFLRVVAKLSHDAGWDARSMAAGRTLVDPHALDGLQLRFQDFMPINAAILRDGARRLLHAAVAPEVSAQDLLRFRAPLDSAMSVLVLPVCAEWLDAREAASWGIGLVVEALTPGSARVVDGRPDPPGGRGREGLSAAIAASAWLLGGPSIDTAEEDPDHASSAAPPVAVARAAELIVSSAAMLFAASDGQAARLGPTDIAEHLKNSVRWIFDGFNDALRGITSPRDRHLRTEGAARSLVWLTHVPELELEAGLHRLPDTDRWTT